ncbi:MAG: hypothetical protein EON58_05810 [Alphaproteobacteria bacterium]|nr:MAG: hypothetical protein EON58_05810 [Alphaproteobacteria bacterium]
MVRLVLHWAWDPIGVRGIPEAIDEYDGYAPAVFELLQRHAPIPEIADYLIHITRDRMGLEPDQNKSLDVAALLTGLHTIQG